MCTIGGGAEADIISSVRDFLILTGLVRSGELREEDPPSGGSDAPMT